MTKVIGQCDKCGGDVGMDDNSAKLKIILVRVVLGPDSEHNEAVLIRAVISDRVHQKLESLKPRHLFPVVRDDRTVCDGSPSLVQYLPGQPRDKRENFVYNPQYEMAVRIAYGMLLDEAMAGEVE